MEIRPVGEAVIHAADRHGQRTCSSRLRERALRNLNVGPTFRTNFRVYYIDTS